MRLWQKRNLSRFDKDDRMRTMPVAAKARIADCC
jgi:hypothetical protein